MRLASVRLSTLLTAHIVCQIPLLYYGAHALSRGIGGILMAVARIQPLFAWAGLPKPPKIESILDYVLLLAFLAAASVAILIGRRLGGRAIQVDGKRAAILTAYELVAIVTVFWQSTDTLLLMLAFYGLLLPVWAYSQIGDRATRSQATPLLLIVCALLAASLFLLPRTAWAPDMRLVSEYRDLPSYTRLDDGRVVENQKFLWQHRLEGSFRFDVCDPRFEGATIVAACLKLPRSAFNGPREAFMLFAPTGGLVYRWDTQTLVAYAPVTPEEQALIQSLWGLDEGNASLRDFVDFVQTSGEIRPYSADHLRNVIIGGFSSIIDGQFFTEATADFLSKAGWETAYQQSLGGFFYHQAYVYVPLLEELTDGGRHVGPSQYGQGLTKTLALLLRSLGPPSFDNYIRLYWALVLAYVLLSAVPGWLLGGGRWGALAAMTGIALVLVAVTSTEALALNPGFNPMRHLPDLASLVAIYLDRRWRRWWTAALRVSILAFFVWWNREFGLFFVGASLTWHGFTVILGTGQRRAAIIQLFAEAIAVGLLLVGLPSAAGNDLLYYNLMGLGPPPARWRFVLIALALWLPAASWLVVRSFGPARKLGGAIAARQETGAIGLLYCALASIYPLWNLSVPHASVILLCAVVPALGAFGGIHGSRRQTMVVASLALASITLLAVQHYQVRQRALDDLVPFSWNFPGLKATVTADPRPLQDSLALIKRYQPTGRLVLISQYDAALYIASGRTPALTYIGLKSVVVSWSLLDKIAQTLRARNAPYIFVDRDIFADRGSEILQGGNGTLWSISSLRVGSLAALGELFREVSDCYEPVQAAGVLEVWRNTCTEHRP